MLIRCGIRQQRASKRGGGTAVVFGDVRFEYGLGLTRTWVVGRGAGTFAGFLAKDAQGPLYLFFGRQSKDRCFTLRDASRSQDVNE